MRSNHFQIIYLKLLCHTLMYGKTHLEIYFKQTIGIGKCIKEEIIKRAKKIFL